MGFTKLLFSRMLDDMEEELCFGGTVQKFQYNVFIELIFILIEFWSSTLSYSYFSKIVLK